MGDTCEHACAHTLCNTSLLCPIQEGRPDALPGHSKTGRKLKVPAISLLSGLERLIMGASHTPYHGKVSANGFPTSDTWMDLVWRAVAPHLLGILEMSIFSLGRT